MLTGGNDSLAVEVYVSADPGRGKQQRSAFLKQSVPIFHCESVHGVPVIYYDFSAAVPFFCFLLRSLFFFPSVTFMRGIKHEWEQNIANSVNIQEAMGNERDKSFFLSSLAVAI